MTLAHATIIEGMMGPLEEWMAAGRFNLAVHCALPRA